MGINVLSLFDGMSCGQIALERAGISVSNYFASEVDKYAIAVTQANYPDTIQLGDVKDIKAADLPKIDLLIGGSPCQGFSLLGKKLAFEDKRSALFFEYTRLLKECSPTNFLFENIPMRKDYLDALSDELGMSPVKINSSLVSAQSRNRYYWFNWEADSLENAGTLAPSIIMRADMSENKEKWQAWWKDKEEYQLKKGYCAVLNDRDKAICCTARQVNNWNGNLVRNADGSLRFINPVEAERLQTVTDNYTALAPAKERYKMLGNGWTVNVVAHIFSSLPILQG